MAKKLDWTTEKSEYILETEWITVRRDTCRMPNGKVVDPYYVMEFPGWINVVALTEQEEIILIRQYRQGLGQSNLELPAGMMEKTDVSPLEAIQRELLEETGYEAEEWIETGAVSPNPANQNNWQYCFLARGAKKVAKQQLDENEQIEVLLKPLSEIHELIAQGQIIQSLNISSIYLAFRKMGRSL